MYHGEEYIKEAEERYNTVANGGVPQDIEIFEIDSKIIEEGISLIDLLVLSKMVPSKSEARRIIEQNGISINSLKNNDVKAIINNENIINEELIIQKGKKQFKKIVIK